MLKYNTSRIIAVLAGLALVTISANAQLLLLNTTGSFTSGGDSNINNGATVSTYETPGVNPAVKITATTSAVPTIVDDSSLTPVSSWTLEKITPAMNSVEPTFNYTLDFNFAGGSAIDLSIVYTINAAVVGSGNTGLYQYSISPSFLTGTFMVDSQSYKYQISNNGGGLVGVGGTTGSVGFDLAVSFTPVPEPSTYALFGVGALGAIVSYRRIRAKKLAA